MPKAMIFICLVQNFPDSLEAGQSSAGWNCKLPAWVTVWLANCVGGMSYALRDGLSSRPPLNQFPHNPSSLLSIFDTARLV